MTVPMALPPIGDVQTRIASIQARFETSASLVPVALTPAVAAPPGAPAASSASPARAPAQLPGAFAAALAQARDVAAPRSAPGLSSVAPATVDDGHAGNGAGERVIEIAKQYLGVPYVWGGTTPRGFDCSGLVQYVYRQMGIELPRVSVDQSRAGRPVASLAEAQPGDLVFWSGSPNHIGIYAGDNKMVVAPRTGEVVRVQEIKRTPTAIRRVLP